MNRRIHDISAVPELDYYPCFCLDEKEPGKRAWPFDHPLPVSIPWRNERHVRQQAVYTVHGRAKLPIEQLWDESVLRRVPFSGAAALHAVRYLREQGIDRFFRPGRPLGPRGSGRI